MPRTYNRKKQGPSYSVEDVARAVNDVINKNCTYRQAEQQYGVPIAVIYHRIKGRKVSADRIGAGRRPVLSEDVEKQKKPEHLQRVRKTARNPEIVYDFYNKLEALYDQNNISTQEKAVYVFNCDQSGLSSDPSRLQAIGEKGKPLSRVSGGSGRESTTVLLCVAADGHFLPPLMVFKGSAVQLSWNRVCGISQWMDGGATILSLV